MVMRMGYRHTAHATYDIKYHLVWITKYRKMVMRGKIGSRIRELIRMVCKNNDVEIIAGHVSVDHVHMLVSVPPHLSVSSLMQKIKGYSSRKIMMEFKEMNKLYWGKHFWARGYFAATSGNVTDDVIEEYIRTQDAKEKSEKEAFTVDEEL